jgi:hypothetical protein
MERQITQYCVYSSIYRKTLNFKISYSTVALHILSRNIFPIENGENYNTANNKTLRSLGLADRPNPTFDRCLNVDLHHASLT